MDSLLTESALKSFLLFSLSLISLLQSFSQNKSSADISYHVFPRLKSETPALEVQFEYETNANGLLAMQFENNSWGENNLFNCIQDLKTFPKADSIKFLRDSSRILIYSLPKTSHRIQYNIVQDYDGLPLNEKRYRPMVDSNYFHVLGMRLFIYPMALFDSDTVSQNIHFQFNMEDSTQTFHSSFGKQNQQTINVTREELYASFFVGGDFRRYAFQVENDSAYFVTRGNWVSFSDNDILKLLQETILAQSDFWKDPRKGNFSVSLVPTYEKWYSIGGSGFSNAFISFASNNEKVTMKQMRWLYNHELLHKWIGRTIQNENEVEQYWFSEGFTDYYAYKLQLKYNHISVTEFIETLNSEIILPHYDDPVRNTPNDSLTFNTYWGNYAMYHKLPYRRGLLYAFYLDNQIKQASNKTESLDQLMLYFLEKSLEDKRFRISQASFLEALYKFLPKTEADSDFEKFILQGSLIDFKTIQVKGLSISTKGNVPLLEIDSSYHESLKDFLSY